MNCESIRKWKPCYDPSLYLGEGVEYKPLDILNHPDIPLHDKVWVGVREFGFSPETLKSFASWCIRDVKTLLKYKEEDTHNCKTPIHTDCNLQAAISACLDYEVSPHTASYVAGCVTRACITYLTRGSLPLHRCMRRSERAERLIRARQIEKLKQMLDKEQQNN